MKKIISAVCLLAVLCTSAIALNGCRDNDEMQVMNVSLNPEVEFILDENDKVVSVNALNEEGNLIINGQAFVGKSADEALELFVSVSKETGFLVEGNYGENQISISLSGDDANKMYNELKNDLNDYLEDQNISATLENAGKLSEEYLKEKVKECMPYLTGEEVEDMDYEDLVESLQQSRQETADMLSQQVKDAYYHAKANAINLAKFEYAKSQLDTISASILNSALSIYKGAIQTIETTRQELLLDENSQYQQALASLREAKVDYLEYREYVASLEQNEVTTAITTQLNNYETALQTAETALENMYNSCVASLNNAELAVTNAYNTLVTKFQSVVSDFHQLLDDAEENINSDIEDFETAFATNYQNYKAQAKAKLDNMKSELAE